MEAGLIFAIPPLEKDIEDEFDFEEWPSSDVPPSRWTEPECGEAVESFSKEGDEPKSFTAVCLGGAGVRGIAELGALHRCYTSERIDLSNVKTFVGTSVGSSIALLLSVGYTPIEIFYYVTKINQWIDFSKADVFRVHQDFGLFDIGVMMKHVKVLIEKKFKYVPTLKQLHERTGKTFRAATVNITKGRIEYVDHNSHPDLSCVDAVGMSCAIPLIFKRRKVNGCYYVDGGLLENLPIGALEENSKALIIGVAEEFSQECADSIVGYMHALSSLPILHNQRMTIANFRPEEHGHTLIVVTLRNAPSAIDFNISKKHRYDMFCEGYRVAEKIIGEM